MRKFLGLSLVLLSLFIAAPAYAQAASLAYDMPAGVTLAQANLWTPVLYVNTTQFPLAHTCSISAGVVTCLLTLPTPAVLAPALTAAGNQNFAVSMKDAVLGVESVQSVPLARLRPVVPINPRFQ